MIQIFLKQETISDRDWDIVYEYILKITTRFPLKLERIEAYNGYQKELNKIHYNLILNKGTANELISFCGDRMSFSSSFTLIFYKSWTVQQDKELSGTTKNPQKPIIWDTPKVYNFTGYPPEANAATIFDDYLASPATYRYAVLAIGIMMENVLPGRAFLISLDDDCEKANHVRLWLEYIFNESFDMPVYFDKSRILEILYDHYDEKEFLTGRLDLLYPKRFKENMEFSLKYIGYRPTLDYYAKVLTHVDFGTFGFSDVFNPWIAATKDINKTLELISRSKEILLANSDNKRNIEKAEKYNYTDILNDLLSQYILWTPEQREFLDNFYTNKKALDSIDDGLFGAIMRIGGYRVDICPIYANAEQLFEAFMYHDPKNGHKYKKMIEDWLQENKNEYNECVEKFSEFEKKSRQNLEKQHEKEQMQEIEKMKMLNEIEQYTLSYAKPERFLVMKALKLNPTFMKTDTAIEQLQTEMYEICKNVYEDVFFLHKKTREEKIQGIRYRIKEKQLRVHPEFINLVTNEADESVLTALYILVGLKLQSNAHKYCRHQLLMNKKYWKIWQQGERLSFVFLMLPGASHAGRSPKLPIVGNTSQI